MKPPPPWLVIAVVLWFTGLIGFSALDPTPAWVWWVQRPLDMVAGLGTGRYLGNTIFNRYKARREGRP